MNIKSRIASIRKSSSLDFPITGVEAFHLSGLELPEDVEFQLPTNIRLGHLAEKIVSELIALSSNYNMLYENIQLLEAKKTIGEIDFIIEHKCTKDIIHVELAYKFYLFDPSISSEPIKNWIGPNRNDSLIEKLEKLKTKQFPLLYHSTAKAVFYDIDIAKTSQVLCLLASLFIPYQYKGSVGTHYEKAIKGFYLSMETFVGMDHTAKHYYLPSKKEWGMEPSENEIWTDFNGIQKHIYICITEKKAPLCWQKHKDAYVAFFIVWW